MEKIRKMEEQIIFIELKKGVKKVIKWNI